MNLLVAVPSSSVNVIFKSNGNGLLKTICTPSDADNFCIVYDGWLKYTVVATRIMRMMYSVLMCKIYNHFNCNTTCKLLKIFTTKFHHTIQVYICTLQGSLTIIIFNNYSSFTKITNINHTG